MTASFFLADADAFSLRVPVFVVDVVISLVPSLPAAAPKLNPLPLGRQRALVMIAEI